MHQLGQSIRKASFRGILQFWKLPRLLDCIPRALVLRYEPAPCRNCLLVPVGSRLLWVSNVLKPYRMLVWDYFPRKQSIRAKPDELSRILLNNESILLFLYKTAQEGPGHFTAQPIIHMSTMRVAEKPVKLNKAHYKKHRDFFIRIAKSRGSRV